jgi:hypothetical protein
VFVVAKPEDDGPVAIALQDEPGTDEGEVVTH